MTRIESKTIEVNKNNNEVFEYLKDMNHLEQLLPMDRLSDYSATSTTASFKVAGAATINLVLHEAIEGEKVVYKTTDGSTFPFTLNVNITSTGDNACSVSQVADADLNPFLKMMVEKPLGKLFDFIADRLPKAMA